MRDLRVLDLAHGKNLGGPESKLEVIVAEALDWGSCGPDHVGPFGHGLEFEFYYKVQWEVAERLSADELEVNYILNGISSIFLTLRAVSYFSLLLTYIKDPTLVFD